MGDATGIEWCDATWNPIVGCQVVSPGCTNCYAMAQAARIERMSAGAGRETHYAGTTTPSKAGPVWTGRIALAPDAVFSAPLRWRRPRRIFVNSMGDLFAPGVTDEVRDRVWATMACASQHTFMVLTKRAAAMRAYCSDPLAARRISEAVCDLVVLNRLDVVLIAPGVDESYAPPGSRVRLGVWPLPNVWLGVTAEDQVRADERIPELLATQAAVRFISYEPAIGPVDFTAAKLQPFQLNPHLDLPLLNSLSGAAIWGRTDPVVYPHTADRLDWVICGGESGPDARPMHPQWARDVRDQCAAAGVPFFFKQWGEFAPEGLWGERWLWRPDGTCSPDPLPNGVSRHAKDGFSVSYRVGKRRAGRVLDGQTHDAFPEVHA